MSEKRRRATLFLPTTSVSSSSSLDGSQNKHHVYMGTVFQSTYLYLCTDIEDRNNCKAQKEQRRQALSSTLYLPVNRILGLEREDVPFTRDKIISNI